MVQTLVHSSFAMYPSKQATLQDIMSYLISIIHPKMRQQLTSSASLSALEKYVFQGI